MSAEAFRYVIVACAFGILAGAAFYALGDLLLRRFRRKHAAYPPAAHVSGRAVPRNTDDETISRFIEAFRSDHGTAGRPK